MDETINDRTAFIAEQAARALAECQHEVEPEQVARFEEYVAEGLSRLIDIGGSDALVKGRGLAAQYARRWARWRAGDLATMAAVDTSLGRWRRAVARS